MKNKRPQPAFIKKIAILVSAVLLFNLSVATVLAAGDREWSPSTGLVIANATAAPSSPGAQARTQMIRSDFSGTPYYIAWWVEDDLFIKAQKYNESGVTQWTPASGITVYNGNTTAPGTTTYDDFATNTVGVPDGNGGIIIAWSDNRNGDYDVFGVRLDDDGAVVTGWSGVNGTQLVDSGIDDYLYDAVSDGTGGIALAYSQHPGTDLPFVHRVDGNGSDHSGFTANEGTDVSGGFGINFSATYHIIAVADGGDADSDPDYIISWGVSSARISKLESGGTLAWGSQAVGGGDNTYHQMLHDGSGGVYYVSNVAAVHVDTDGNSDACFGDTDGAPCDAGQIIFDSVDTSAFSKVVSDNADGLIITWFAGSPAEIRTQRYDPAGIEQWDGDLGTGGNQPVTVSHSTANADTPIIEADGSGGAYIAWQDSRNVFPNVDIFSQHINSSGTLTFGGGTTDVQITDLTGRENISPISAPNPGDNHPGYDNIAITSTGGFLIVWDDDDLTGNFIQKVDTSGSIQFAASGQSLIATAPTPVNQNNQKVAALGDGTYVIAWVEPKNGNNDIYAQRVDISGNYLWPSVSPAVNGTAVVNAVGDQPMSGDSFSMIPVISATASERGVIITWSDSRDAADLYALRLKTDGTAYTGWTANGNMVSNTGVSSGLAKQNPVLVTDGATGALIAWEEQVPAGEVSEPMIKGQRITGAGVLSWDGSGGIGTQPVDISSAADASTETSPKIASDGVGGALIAYEKADANIDIEAARVTSAGTVSWRQPVADTGVDEVDAGIVADGGNGVIVSYTYANPGNFDINAQRLDENGNKVWAANGVAVSDETGDQTISQIVSDNVTPENGAIITWKDERAANSDIYAQRIDSAGIERWTTDGVAIADTSANQDSPAIVSNNGSGAVIVFTSDPGSGLNNIYAQQVNGTGVEQWTADGVLVETDVARIDSAPALASDANAGAIIAWDGTTSGTSDVFAQYMSDTVGIICAEGGPETFCGQQEIRNAILSFFDIPDSFTFAPVTVASTAQPTFNNTDPINNTGTENLDDLLIIEDTRNSGGFIVQVSAEGDFSDGTDTLPIENLHIVTSTSDNLSNYTATDGVIYEDTISDPAVQNINAPVDAGGNNADVNNAAIYTALLPDSQFSLGGTINLMEGTLASSSGRDGKMSQFISYYLNVPGLQPAGDYAVVLTYTLFDDTTP